MVDWQTPAVMEKARLLTQGAADARAVERTLFEFVRDEIRHSEAGGEDQLTCRASEVLRHGAGIGCAKSHLLAALLRSRGVPAGFGYQRQWQPDVGRHVLHGFCGIFDHEEGRWCVLDARGGTPEHLCAFDLEHPRLASEPDPDLGEEVCLLIFARPHRGVVDVLTRAPDLDRALRHLPGDLPTQ